jgi:hypothetical protein
MGLYYLRSGTGPLCVVWFGLAGHLPPAERCAAPGLGPGQGVQDPRSLQDRLRRPRALRHLRASARHLVDAGRLILLLVDAGPWSYSFCRACPLLSYFFRFFS